MDYLNCGTEVLHLGTLRDAPILHSYTRTCTRTKIHRYHLRCMKLKTAIRGRLVETGNKLIIEHQTQMSCTVEHLYWPLQDFCNTATTKHNKRKTGCTQESFIWTTQKRGNCPHTATEWKSTVEKTSLFQMNLSPLQTLRTSETNHTASEAHSHFLLCAGLHPSSYSLCSRKTSPPIYF